jgi:glycyl-tRNA synthetase (class II)
MLAPTPVTSVPCPAAAQGIIANETLAYFIGRTWLFFKKVGINPQRMRFRQHLVHEVGSCDGVC